REVTQRGSTFTMLTLRIEKIGTEVSILIT
ncbi:unnamed protein product, partial [marine sediment metagenome]